MATIVKLLRVAWIWTGFAWLVSDSLYIALMVFASGDKHRYFDAAAGYTAEISVGRGNGRTVYVTHTYRLIYDGLLDLALSCLGLFVLGVIVFGVRAKLKKSRAQQGV